MTLQQLRYILTVAKCESINEAAKQLFISQPTLSHAIKDLETEIGMSIFQRSNKGIIVTPQGHEFLGYARQVLAQYSLLEDKYLNKKSHKVKFSISTQHYSFAVNAFVDLIQEYNQDEYDFQIRETRTYEIIEDVKNFTSEIGILYLNEFNSQVIQQQLKENGLQFYPLFTAKPHVFLGKNNPLSRKDKVTLNDLEDYPYLSFEQGQHNAFYYCEEILSTIHHKRSIKVSDRATLFNLLIGLHGYTICTGIISQELNGPDIISVPLDVDENIHIGYILNKNTTLSLLGKTYIEMLKASIQ